MRSPKARTRCHRVSREPGHTNRGYQRSVFGWICKRAKDAVPEDACSIRQADESRRQVDDNSRKGRRKYEKSGRKVEVKLKENRSKVEEKSKKSPSKVHDKSKQRQRKIDEKSTKGRRKVDEESTKHRCIICNSLRMFSTSRELHT